MTATPTIMNISNVPVSKVLASDGSLASPFRLYFDQLTTQLQTYLGGSFYQLPSNTSANITTIQTNKNVPSIVHDSDQQNVQVNTNGAYNIVCTYNGNATTTEINAIPSGQRNGRFYWDTTAGNLKFGVNDTFKVITTM